MTDDFKPDDVTIRIVDALEASLKARSQRPPAMEAILPQQLARVLAAGGHACREAVTMAADDYVHVNDTVQDVEQLTSLLGACDDTDPLWQLVRNIRIRTRRILKGQQQLLKDLRVTVQETCAGAKFEPHYHRPQNDTIPAGKARDEGKIAEMVKPAFVWFEEGLEQVIHAEVILFGPPTPMKPRFRKGRKG